MLSARLPLLSDGPAPQSRVVIYRPRAGEDLSFLTETQVEIVQGFKPDAEVFAQAGYPVHTQAEGEFDLAIVCVPRSKREAHALIADAAQRAKRVIVDGQKTDGIDSIVKDIRKRVSNVEIVSKAHGKAAAFDGGEFADWVDPGPLHLIDGFVTRLGVFSVDRVDAASKALLELLPERLPRRIADLGAGWGYLSRAILAHDEVELLHVVEAEAAALACARDNLNDPRAMFHWADATTFTPPERVDAVIMNPPFHTSRAADPALGQAFIASAAKMLTPQGQLWLVANTQLPYEATLAAHFGSFDQIGRTNGFKVLHASKPLRRGG